MTTSINSSLLKDVIAYVDVWSSDKRANFSKSFIQQLEEMGARVSKRFSKQVTHVVFNNGHPATWRKAKKSGVRLVSVLWVRRCYDDGAHLDEESFPAIHDESNPVMNNRKHRCMLPKDSPERTTENDWRMRKKLDKMMKDLTPKEPLVKDMSPIIIDEENGIIYSPALKRSDYMAQRLKDMKDKRENLSPTASQMAETCSPTGLKPSLGSTPTVFKFKLHDQSDDDSCASVADLGVSPDKEEGRSRSDFGSCEHLERDSLKPWLSPCRDVPTRIPSVPDCPHFEEKEDKEGKKETKSRRTSVRKKATEKLKSGDFLESPLKERSGKGKTCKEKKQSRIRSSSPSPNEKTEQTMGPAKVLMDTESHIYCDAVNSLNSLSSSNLAIDASTEISKKACLLKVAKRKAPKRATSTPSALMGSLTLFSESKHLASNSTDADDVFEDYFSPANHRKPVIPNLPVESNMKISFELGSSPKKRKKINLEFAVKSRSELKMNTVNCTSCLIAGVTLPAPPYFQLFILFSNVGGGDECMAAAGFTKIPLEAEESHKKQDSLTLQKMVKKTKPVRTLVMTSMPTEKQHTVVQVVKALGVFSIVDRVCESTTHVVSGGHRRTLNILLGIARGCWILSFEWILWCLEQRQWIPEEPYELSDQFPAAQICRLQRHLSAGEHQQDLFQTQPTMFVSQHSQPPAQSLVELIQLCGGTVCKSVRQAGLCIGKYSGRRPEGSKLLSEQWILDSISNLKILSYDNYDLE
ncbi:microcephalin [Xenentodon cancila]